jgi:transposase InsO family protein
VSVSIQPRWGLPGRSTACDILRRHGMVPLRRQRRRLGHPGKPTSQILAPNDVWSADYKGQFRTGDGRYCYPLTVADGFSRYLLGCQALPSTAGAEAKPIFTRLFQEYGLPRRIRSDNGVPFATTTLARLSKLSAWWIRLGIRPELIEPGRPDQNGRHERMHRTLKAGVDGKSTLRDFVEVVRERPVEMEGRTPELQCFGLHREVVSHRLVQFGPLIIVDPVGAEEAGVRQRKDERARSSQHSGEFRDRHIDARNIHEDHICQDQIEVAIRQR